MCNGDIDESLMILQPIFEGVNFLGGRNCISQELIIDFCSAGQNL